MILISPVHQGENSSFLYCHSWKIDDSERFFVNPRSISLIIPLNYEKFIKQIMDTITKQSIFIDKSFQKIRTITSVIHRHIHPHSFCFLFWLESFVNLFVNQSECEKICYLKADDFHLNHRITIFNQVFLLYDCDSFTRDFYEMNVHH